MNGSSESAFVMAGMEGNQGVASIHVDTVIRKRLRSKGTAARPVRSIVRAIDLIASGRWDLPKMATSSCPLERAAEAVESLQSADRPDHARLEPDPALVRY
ncbi:hypothetical protein [Pseudofrankia asymbiotica]|uniref:Uncharacterized protein n=1 Tax=Pseudofrankia asymbiotica TaxID=1834516 RepID=A0A1V2I5K2_9ACTN|nr:hypothetical protein [Pseudofrankia asymbiotica]ONH26417.1 hypothetical protein BL253_24865 [Pseudofrankia asymbiotica]